MEFDQLKTARQIARDSGVPLHRVDYAIQRINLAESTRIGIVRLYDGAKVAQIAGALAEIAARRTGIRPLGVCR